MLLLLLLDILDPSSGFVFGDAALFQFVPSIGRDPTGGLPFRSTDAIACSPVQIGREGREGEMRRGDSTGGTTWDCPPLTTRRGRRCPKGKTSRRTEIVTQDPDGRIDPMDRQPLSALMHGIA